MRFRKSVRYITDQVDPVIEDVPADDVDRFIDLVLDADKVVIFGRGRSGLVGKALAIRLVHLGIDTYVVGETITPPVAEGDVVVLLSGSGETFSVVVTGQVARELGSTVVTVTEDRDTTLGKLADLVIELPVATDDPQRPEHAPLGTLFEDAAGLLMDGIVAHLMEVLGETEDDMRARHATLE